MRSAWGASGNFFTGKSGLTSGSPCQNPPLEDWLDLLDAMQRLVTRRRYQPDDEVRLRKQIRERFPEAEV